MICIMYIWTIVYGMGWGDGMWWDVESNVISVYVDPTNQHFHQAATPAWMASEVQMAFTILL